ncbi:MAG: hypothetical protein JOZ07_01430 [Solirubrobacterales bacterium]|nr:hypothetical protein [Solirubrobacterales bacterium]
MLKPVASAGDTAESATTGARDLGRPLSAAAVEAAPVGDSVEIRMRRAQEAGVRAGEAEDMAVAAAQESRVCSERGREVAERGRVAEAAHHQAEQLASEAQQQASEADDQVRTAEQLRERSEATATHTAHELHREDANGELTTYNKPELGKLAEGIGIDKPTTMTKNQLVDAIGKAAHGEG